MGICFSCFPCLEREERKKNNEGIKSPKKKDHYIPKETQFDAGLKGDDNVERLESLENTYVIKTNESEKKSRTAPKNRFKDAFKNQNQTCSDYKGPQDSYVPEPESISNTYSTLSASPNQDPKINEEKLVKKDPEKINSPTQILYFTLLLNPQAYEQSKLLDGSYDLLVVKCRQCKQNNKKIFAFLCNHNLCEDCLSLHCAYRISDFFNQYLKDQSKIFEFSYCCPASECGFKISLPTLFVLKKVRGWLRDDWFRQNYSGLVFLDDPAMDLWVPYFDGVIIN